MRQQTTIEDLNSQRSALSSYRDQGTSQQWGHTHEQNVSVDGLEEDGGLEQSCSLNLTYFTRG